MSTPGDLKDARHGDWLAALGAATDAAASLATTCLDLVRVLAGCLARTPPHFLRFFFVINLLVLLLLLLGGSCAPSRPLGAGGLGSTDH